MLDNVTEFISSMTRGERCYKLGWGDAVILSTQYVECQHFCS